jgi:hypothetical protein
LDFYSANEIIPAQFARQTKSQANREHVAKDDGAGRVWNRIPDDLRGRLVDLALNQPDLSPRGNWR